jgi:hypothetical protein
MLRRLERVMERFYRTPALLLSLASLFWAGNTIAGRLAIDQIPPLLLVFLRWVLVIAVLWPIYGPRVLADTAHTPRLTGDLTGRPRRSLAAPPARIPGVALPTRKILPAARKTALPRCAGCVPAARDRSPP